MPLPAPDAIGDLTPALLEEIYADWAAGGNDLYHQYSEEIFAAAGVGLSKTAAPVVEAP